ncbi:MAG: metallophosphoesterase [Pseudomonadales bacterium]
MSSLFEESTGPTDSGEPAAAGLVPRAPMLLSGRRAVLEARLEDRLGRIHARQRLGIEEDHATQMFRRARSVFHPENWYSFASLVRTGLRVAGLYQRAMRNAHRLLTVEHAAALPGLPQAFDGYRILHLSDLHIDVSEQTAHAIIEAARGVEYDLCVLTGDYRFRTTGDSAATLHNLARLRANLRGDVYAVLGNHDSVLMLPDLEDMGIRVLMNESVALERDGEFLYLAGIDDAHFFGVENFEKALDGVPPEAATVLLSHTPEVYRQAAHCGVDLLLCGHTHGGQICLPGRVPLLLDARIPRRMGRGAWRHHRMLGYTSPGAGTSIVEVRLNCPPEITVHTLEAAAAP